MRGGGWMETGWALSVVVQSGPAALEGLNAGVWSRQGAGGCVQEGAVCEGVAGGVCKWGC